jgi:phosphoribosylamine--glycine ligase
MRILVVGSGAREHSIALALKKSTHPVELFCFGSSTNPGIKELCIGYTTGKLDDAAAIAAFALQSKIDFAVIGPELPLSVGVVDALSGVGIPSVGPTQQMAQVESSKTFTRDLFKDYAIPGLAKYRAFKSIDGLEDYCRELNDSYVVKADGLMGGKGVKVYGEHLNSFNETKKFCEEILSGGGSFLIEEKFVGQEFSLMSFSDGTHVAHMPAVQDHKRAFVGDTGPNTGGMGSYSDTNHSLPFLKPSDIAEAQKINELSVAALNKKFGSGYKGILYGGFMATKDGVKIIEYNARFGDPECMNVLALLESDFIELCQAIIAGNLAQNHARFAKQATVCKYAVPVGYPDRPIKDEVISIAGVTDKTCLRFASLDARGDKLIETGSRTIAVITMGKSIKEAEAAAEAEINRISGPLFHREDIGTAALIEKRVEMMKQLRG